jgi:hypothetical protein
MHAYIYQDPDKRPTMEEIVRRLDDLPDWMVRLKYSREG